MDISTLREEARDILDEVVALRRTGAEWVVAVDVMAMAMTWCVWSETRSEGLQLREG